MDFIVVIPARYHASRLPAKLLANIHGKPLIQYTYENAQSSNATQVVIATDDRRIEKAAQGFGATTCMTSVAHCSGTARIAEVLEQLSVADDTVVVNVQGDEPMLDGQVIDQVAHNLVTSQMHMATLSEPITNKQQYLDPNCVKVVFNALGKALYFSRAPIPAFRETDAFDTTVCFKHIGIYAYSAAFVRQYANMGHSTYEQAENLEQLRILHQGYSIHVAAACASTGFGVDTAEDLAQVREALQ